MRIRTALAFALLLPSVSSAQARRPRIGGADPGQPVPLSPQPAVVARSQNFVRSRYAVESYPIISRTISPRIAGTPASSWTSFGSGARLDWRSNRYMSFTLDLTSAFLGGQALTGTTEVGVRIRPESWESRLRPFADARVGYEQAGETFPSQSNLGIGPAAGVTSRYSRGFGAVVGGGVEYGLTNTIALTAGASAMRSSMAAYKMTGVSIPTGGDRFTMTTYRLTVGFRYNPVHMLTSSLNGQTR